MAKRIIEGCGRGRSAGMGSAMGQDRDWRIEDGGCRWGWCGSWTYGDLAVVTA